jgi:hypothetical protein
MTAAQLAPSDFYGLESVLRDQDRALLAEVRDFMRDQVASIANDYWSFCTSRMRETTGWARELLAGNGILVEHDVALRGPLGGDLLLRGHPRDELPDRGARDHRGIGLCR